MKKPPYQYHFSENDEVRVSDIVVVSGYPGRWLVRSGGQPERLVTLSRYRSDGKNGIWRLTEKGQGRDWIQDKREYLYIQLWCLWKFRRAREHRRLMATRS